MPVKKRVTCRITGIAACSSGAPIACIIDVYCLSSAEVDALGIIVDVVAICGIELHAFREDLQILRDLRNKSVIAEHCQHAGDVPVAADLRQICIAFRSFLDSLGVERRNQDFLNPFEGITSVLRAAVDGARPRIDAPACICGDLPRIDHAEGAHSLILLFAEKSWRLT